jgi:hypothetical protein
VPFESFADALFWRLLACGDPARARGGDPALAERDL